MAKDAAPILRESGIFCGTNSAHLNIDAANRIGGSVFHQSFPEGKWITWMSDESGQDKIYLSDFPAVTRKRQISRVDPLSARGRQKEMSSITSRKTTKESFESR